VVLPIVLWQTILSGLVSESGNKMSKLQAPEPVPGRSSFVTIQVGRTRWQGRLGDASLPEQLPSF